MSRDDKATGVQVLANALRVSRKAQNWAGYEVHVDPSGMMALTKLLNILIQELENDSRMGTPKDRIAGVIGAEV